ALFSSPWAPKRLRAKSASPGIASSSRPNMATANQERPRLLNRLPVRPAIDLLPHQSTPPQVVQHQSVEWHLITCEQIRDAAPRTEFAESSSVGRKVLLVAFQKRRAYGDFSHIFVFNVDQPQIADDFRIYLFLGENLDYVNVKLPRHKVAKRFFVSPLVHQVAEKDDDPFATTFQRKRAKRSPQIAWPGRLDFLHKIHHPPQTAASSRRRHALRQAIVERLNDDTVHIYESDKAQRGGHLLGIAEFGWRAEIHRQAVVQENVEVKIFFFHEQPNEEAV